MKNIYNIFYLLFLIQMHVVVVLFSNKKTIQRLFSCLGKAKEKTSNIGLDTSNIKEKKTLSDWFKKKK